MEKKIVFTPVEPNKNLLWLHYKNGLLVLQRFGSNGWEDITNSDQITEAEVMELIKDKANLVGGKVPAEELPSYVDDVIEFNGLLDPSTRISTIVGNSSNKNRTYFISGSDPNSGRVGSSDKYPYMFVNFGENTSEEDWISETPERGKIYLNVSNDHSYRWTGSELLDLDKNWSTAIVGLSQNTIRMDTSQDSSTERENQALSNIGSGLFVIDLIDGKATLTADQEAKLLSSSGVILRGTVNAGKEVLTKIYFADYQEGDQVSFWAVRNNRYSLQCIYTKSTKLFQFLTSANYIDPNAVSIKKQTLSATEQARAFANLGMKVYVTDSSFLGSTLSAEEIEQVVASKALLFTDTGDLFLLGTLDSTKVTFARVKSNNIIDIITVTKSTGGVSLLNSYNFRDNEALRFVTQSPALTSAQQDVTLSNIGLDFVHIDYSLLGTTLTDAQVESISNSRGIILTNETNYDGPTVFIKGHTGSIGQLFFAQDASSVVRQIDLNINNKTLSTISSIELHFDSVRYSATQSLTAAQIIQVFSNLGVQAGVMEHSEIGPTLTAGRVAELLASHLLLDSNGDIYIKAGTKMVSSDIIQYYWEVPQTETFFQRLTLTVNNVHDLDNRTGTLSYDNISYRDSSAVRIGTQTISEANRAIVRSNIGVESPSELLADNDFIAQLKTKLETA